MHAQGGQTGCATHLAETTLLEQTTAFCEGLLLKDKTGVEKKGSKPVIAPDSSKNVLVKKEDREEVYYFTSTKMLILHVSFVVI